MQYIKCRQYTMYTKVYAVLGGHLMIDSNTLSHRNHYGTFRGKKIFHLASIYYGIVLQNTKERIHFCLSKKMQ